MDLQNYAKKRGKEMKDKKLMGLKHYNSSKYNNERRFISYHYQLKNVVENIKNGEKILEIGVGNKTLSNLLKNIGYKVKTIDILPELKPDVIGDVRKLPFDDNEFQAVLCYEVLEHLPYKDFIIALSELDRVSQKFVFISLPYWNASFEFIFKFPMLGLFKDPPFFRIHLAIPYFFRNLDSKEHYWEVGAKGYPKRKIRNDLHQFFWIEDEYTILLNNHHIFFNCISKECQCHREYYDEDLYIEWNFEEGPTF